MDIVKPENLKVWLCPWVKNHADKGENEVLNIGGKQYHVVALYFERWVWMDCSVSFCIEFTRQFRDRLMEVIVKPCPECIKELDQDLNRLIIDSHGIPPK